MARPRLQKPASYFEDAPIYRMVKRSDGRLVPQPDEIEPGEPGGPEKVTVTEHGEPSKPCSQCGKECTDGALVAALGASGCVRCCVRCIRCKKCGARPRGGSPAGWTHAFARRQFRSICPDCPVVELVDEAPHGEGL